MILEIGRFRCVTHHIQTAWSDCIWTRNVDSRQQATITNSHSATHCNRLQPSDFLTLKRVCIHSYHSFESFVEDVTQVLEIFRSESTISLIILLSVGVFYAWHLASVSIDPRLRFSTIEPLIVHPQIEKLFTIHRVGVREGVVGVETFKVCAGCCVRLTTHGVETRKHALLVELLLKSCRIH